MCSIGEYISKQKNLLVNNIIIKINRKSKNNKKISVENLPA